MKLFLNYLSLHLKIALEYKSSFIMTVIAQLFYMISELIAVIAIIAKFRLFDLYSLNEVLFSFSILWLGYSIIETFGRGFDEFAPLIISGDFDILLTRPRSIFIQIIGSKIAYEKMGRLIVSLGLFIYSTVHLINHFTILKIILIILTIIGSSLIYLSIFIFGAALSFVTIQGLEVVNIFSNGSKQLGQYPMKIYHKYVRLFFTFIIPITLVNYYPLVFLKGITSNYLYILLPLLTVVLFLMSLLTFNIGLKKYCSTGS